MPVKDREGKRFMREGKIRLGYRAWSCAKCQLKKIPVSEKCPKCGAACPDENKSYPVETPYFIIPKELQPFLGERPTELDIMLPLPNPVDNFDMSYIVWGANSGAMCVGDGNYVSYAVPMLVSDSGAAKRAPGTPLVVGGHATKDFSFGDHSFRKGDKVECPGRNKELYPQCAKCSLSGYLRIIFADPSLYTYKFWQIDTRSGRNYDTIKTSIEQLYAEIENLTGRGFVNGIKCKLERVMEVAYPINEKSGMPMKVEKYFLHLSPDPDFMRSLYDRKRERVLSSSLSVPLLEAGDDSHFTEVDPQTIISQEHDDFGAIDAEFSESELRQTQEPPDQATTIDLYAANEMVMPNGEIAGDIKTPVLLAMLTHPKVTDDQKRAVALIVEARKKAQQ